MTDAPTIVLIPGLLCSPRLYGEQLPALWRHGAVMVADHTRDDSMAGIAHRLLGVAPRRFVLVGLSMGGYTAFEVMRRASDRVARLALLDTSARPDTPEQSERRRAQIALAQNGRFAEVLDPLFLSWVHRARRSDQGLRQIVQRMAEESGPEVFVRQQTAIMTRPDSRPDLAAIRCPTLVSSATATKPRRRTGRPKSRRASPVPGSPSFPSVATCPRSSSLST